MSIPDEKSRLRREIKSARVQISAAERYSASFALSQRLWSFLLESDVPCVGVYLATPAEISLDPLIENLLQAGIEVSAPRVDLESNSMAFFHMTSLEDVQNGPWNLRQPRSERQITPPLLLIPGVAFDARGHRLGMGAGWYDRTLSSGVQTVGICYDWQIIPHVPTEEHDYPMTWVFSDKRTFGPFG
ncbi:5-formyltetrahydrofolate cyclo-ligase [bacterium]|nr:MAG: 5-formyltetrahydrofolate cyclo-ligase [bacterium]